MNDWDEIMIEALESELEDLVWNWALEVDWCNEPKVKAATLEANCDFEYESIELPKISFNSEFPTFTVYVDFSGLPISPDKPVKTTEMILIIRGRLDRDLDCNEKNWFIKDYECFREFLGVYSKTDTSFSDLLSKLAAYPRGLWFRGQADDSWGLQANVWRFNTAPEKELEVFLKRASYKMPHDLKEEELLFKMQHHGALTKLLDWTTNPLVALYFAAQNRSEAEANSDWLQFG